MDVSRAILDCRLLAHRTAQCDVALSGEVDLASGPRMQVFLTHHLEHRASGEEVRVDMSGIGFFSAAGLRELVVVARRARTAGVRLRLHPVSPAVDRLLRVSGVWPEFERGAGAPTGPPLAPLPPV